MNGSITRRDFINGVAVAITGLSAAPRDVLCESAGPTYPSQLQGLRGSHAGSFEVAHSLRDGLKFDASAVVVSELYDLIVVGGGISGLSAAYFYRRLKPSARILIIESNDDFGGHAKRNEFNVDGRQIIAYGGTQSIDSPGEWSPVARRLLRELGVDLNRFRAAFDSRFNERWSLSHAVFFKAEIFGADKLVKRSFGRSVDYDEITSDRAALLSFVHQFPISPAARDQFVEICCSDRDPLAGSTREQRLIALEHISYRDFLLKYWNADGDVLKVLQKRTHELWAVGIDAVPASLTLNMPGMKAQRAALKPPAPEPYIYHFPDGNASIARLLVRSLIPGSAPGHTMEDIVEAEFDYARLDTAEGAVKIRLGATAVHALNTSEGVEVVLSKHSKLTRVGARHCVMACYNAMVPYLLPQLPAAQAAALHSNVRAPLVYVNVAVRNWQAWHRLGVFYIENPGGMFSATLDFPVSLGGYDFSSNPSQPVCLHLVHTPAEPDKGLTAKEQYRAGRARLYAMTYGDFEHVIRDELTRMLGAGGFDFDRDVAGITVNRWPHGYAYTPTSLFDEPRAQANIAALARQPLGRISIGNSDAGWDAYSQVAIDQANRAVGELLQVQGT